MHRYLKIVVFAIVCTMFCGQSVVAEPQQDVVGFWTFELQPGFNLIAFPVLPDSPTPQEVIGDRLGDVEITTWDGNLGRYRWARYNTETGKWSGDLYLFDRGVAYWINLFNTDVNQRLVVTGRPEQYRKFHWSSLKTGWNFYAPTFGRIQNLEDLPPDRGGDMLIVWNRDLSRFEMALGTSEHRWYANNFDRIDPDRSYVVHLNRNSGGDDNATNYTRPPESNLGKGSHGNMDGQGGSEGQVAYIPPPYPLVVSNRDGLPVCQPSGEACPGGFTVTVVKEVLIPGADGYLVPSPQVVAQRFIHSESSVDGSFCLPLTVGSNGGQVARGDRIYLIAGINGMETRSTSFEVPDGIWLIEDVSFPEPLGTPGESPTAPRSFALGNPYPNPFNDRFQVEFSLPETETLRYALYDINGRTVKSTSSPFSAGTHRLSFSGSDLAAGIYFFEVSYRNERKIAKVAFVK